MTTFSDSPVGQAFIASAASRETSPEIMKAIAFFANDEREAVALWGGDGIGEVATLSDLWERITGNGRRDPREFCWGAAGNAWWDHLQERDQ